MSSSADPAPESREQAGRDDDPSPWPPGLIRLRQVVNVVNLATPFGLVVAAIGRARLTRGPYGLILARDYRAPVPAPNAPAVTIGDVVLLRLDDERLARRPQLLVHEARHAVQYTFWLGPLGFLPAYLLCSAWSWWRTGDFALGNAFERRAGLADGGYLRGPRAGAAAGRPRLGRLRPDRLRSQLRRRRDPAPR